MRILMYILYKKYIYFKWILVNFNKTELLNKIKYKKG